MSLSKKYNVPQETITKMVQDGVISCSWPRYEEIYAQFKSLTNSGLSSVEACYQIAEKEGINERTVRNMVYRIGKI